MRIRRETCRSPRSVTTGRSLCLTVSWNRSGKVKFHCSRGSSVSATTKSGGSSSDDRITWPQSRESADVFELDVIHWKKNLIEGCETFDSELIAMGCFTLNTEVCPQPVFNEMITKRKFVAEIGLLHQFYCRQRHNTATWCSFIWNLKLRLVWEQTEDKRAAQSDQNMTHFDWNTGFAFHLHRTLFSESMTSYRIWWLSGHCQT